MLAATAHHITVAANATPKLPPPPKFDEGVRTRIAAAARAGEFELTGAVLPEDMDRSIFRALEDEGYTVAKAPDKGEVTISWKEPRKVP